MAHSRKNKNQASHPFYKMLAKVAEEQQLSKAALLDQARVKRTTRGVLYSLGCGYLKLTKDEYARLVEKYPRLKEVQAPELMEKLRAKPAEKTLRSTAKAYTNAAPRMSRAAPRLETRLTNLVTAIVALKTGDNTVRENVLTMLYGVKDSGFTVDQLINSLS